MKPTVALILLVFPCSVFSQTDTVKRYFREYYTPCEKENAWYVRIGYPSGNKWYAKEFIVSGDILNSEGFYTDASLQTEDGMFKFYSATTYAGGGAYKQGKKTGSWQFVYDDGRRKDTAYYVDGIQVGAARSWYNSGKLMTSSETDAQGNGTEKGLYENGKVEHTGTYSNGKKNGQWTYYYPNGKPSAIETMTADSVLSTTCFDEEGKSTTKNCGQSIESDFKGGQQAWLNYLSKKASRAQYPPGYFKKQIYGTVIVQFIIDQEGNVTNVEVIKSVHPALDAIAVDIIKTSPKWQPAIQHNRYVKSYKKQPITFPRYPY